MEINKFTGWVEKILEAGPYSQEIVVANYKSDDDKDAMVQAFKDKKSKDYPTALKFQASVKSGAADQLTNIHEGDKVTIQFCLSGKSGVSKKTGNYYCINELNICKKDGVVVVEYAKLEDNAKPVEEPESFDDIPF